MRNKFTIFFFLIMVSGLYAESLKSITINEIGEHDITWWSLIINTHAQEQGFQYDRKRDPPAYFEFAVDETTFDEIIKFINNKKLFGERYLFGISEEYRTGSYSSVELFIENEGKKYYLYLFNKRISAMFFYGLLKIISGKSVYKELAAKLEEDIRYFGFDGIIPLSH